MVEASQSYHPQLSEQSRTQIVRAHLILSRTAEGRQRAKARGVRFGRRPKLTKHQQSEAMGRIAQGETLVAIARS